MLIKEKKSCIWNKLIISCHGLIIFGIIIFKIDGFELEQLAQTIFEVILRRDLISKDTHSERHPQIKLFTRLRKSMNKLFIRGSYIQIRFSKK